MPPCSDLQRVDLCCKFQQDACLGHPALHLLGIHLRVVPTPGQRAKLHAWRAPDNAIGLQLADLSPATPAMIRPEEVPLLPVPVTTQIISGTRH
eukprot:5548101-Lingulodinium_polyedra.AAC.1